MLQDSITYLSADFNEGFVENCIFSRKKELKIFRNGVILFLEMLHKEREE